MTWAVKKVLVGILACFLAGGTAGATVSVSPVVLEAVQVEVGQVFQIFCQNWGEEEITMDLTLALFDQDESGSVIFLEDAQGRARAKKTLNVDVETLSIEPNGRDVIQVELLQDDFDHLYAVLFIKPRQGGIQTRFAVLFLLSTAGSEGADMTVLALDKQHESLTFTVQNNGLRHGPWQGELHFFDVADQLNEKRQISSGLILAGRRRGVQVSLPPWVHRVEVRSSWPEQTR